MRSVQNRRLRQSALDGDVDTLRSALDAGADLEVQDQEGWTALHQAAHHGCTECVVALIDAGADPSGVKISSEPLLEVARRNGWNRVRSLLERNALLASSRKFICKNDTGSFWL